MIPCCRIESISSCNASRPKSLRGCRALGTMLAKLIRCTLSPDSATSVRMATDGAPISAPRPLPRPDRAMRLRLREQPHQRKQQTARQRSICLALTSVEPVKPRVISSLRRRRRTARRSDHALIPYVINCVSGRSLGALRRPRDNNTNASMGNVPRDEPPALLFNKCASLMLNRYQPRRLSHSRGRSPSQFPERFN